MPATKQPGKQGAGRKTSRATRADARRHQAAFLAAFGETGSITKASEAAGVDRREHYRWLKDDASYAERWAEADEELTTRLEAEAVRRAMEGTPEPVIHQGKVVTTVDRYSDRLLELLLKARRPARYRERTTMEHTGPGGGPVKVMTWADTVVAAAEAAQPAPKQGG